MHNVLNDGVNDVTVPGKCKPWYLIALTGVPSVWSELALVPESKLCPCD